MIQGEFNSRGELFFEVGLMSADADIVPVMAMLDTGWWLLRKRSLWLRC
jgi:hypothetical protein